MVETKSFQISSNGFGDILDITMQVESEVESSEVDDGTATVFVSGSTAGLTTIEFEPGAVNDLKKAVDRQAPMDIHYDHDSRWGDDNGFSHVRAALMGPSLTVPFNGKKLCLGSWQQIILCDFDNRPRTREILVQIIG